MSAILHISDLHFSNYEKESIVTDGYKLKFFNKLKGLTYNSNQVHIKYIIVTGDISDGGAKKDLNKAKEFLNELIDELNIDKKNVIICPGNHDICWHKLQNFLDETEDVTKEPYKYHKIKFENFELFYDDFFEKTKTFNPESSIVDLLIDEEDKLLILSLNSCYKESFKKEDHIGFIHFNSLKEKIESLDKNILENYNKIVIMHHNPHHFEHDAISIKNWSDISELLLDFPSILNGHIHSSKGESVTTKNSKYFVSVGSLSKNDIKIKNSFNVLLPSPQEPQKYKVLYYEYEKADTPYWQHHSEKNSIGQITLNVVKGEKVLDKIDNASEQPPEMKRLADSAPSKDTAESNKQEPVENNFSELVDELIRIIEENKLFKSGHYHWSKDFRTHGIIDINYLISRQDFLDLIVQLFYLKIESLDIKPDLIVGIGISGNTIGARLSVMFPDVEYSFVPDELKKEFSTFEKKVKEGEYQKILFIKDIIYNAHTLNELFEHETFKEVSRMLIFSLFYCGKRNTEKLVFKDKTNTELYSICNEIVIEQCPHKGDVKECSIVKHNLDSYYELYT